MDADQIEKFLDALGSSADIRYSGGWINSACPFASYRHRKGTDKRPSFGVSVQPGTFSNVRCFGCGLKTDLKTLLWKLVKLRGRGPWYDRACKIVMREGMSLDEIERRLAYSDNPSASLDERFKKATFAFSTPKASTPKGGKKVLSVEHLEYDPIAEEELEKFREIPPEVMDYLTSPRRKLQHTAIELWQLGWQPYSRRIVIPVRDWHGKLVCMSGRALDKKTDDGGWEPERDPKFLHTKGFKRDYFLFGEHLVDKNQPGILVEGHFDAIYLRQMGYPNTVAVMGSWLSAVQVEKILAMFTEVTILPDGDMAGGEAALKWEHALKGRVPVKVLDVLTDHDPDDYDDEQLLELFGFDNPLPSW